ncbi:MAG: Gfo/Idh/MocA family oxidoreductase [Pirellulales bacterium]|nr:Gfo/Idh/MocA family oxidoreductase [Thermoguttaceae bacterium]MDD4785795.1 Gfo/Idh/MocA family oxidoreductase [Pirellulales bacterium]MDI9443907.1 Gfo/Idh/MocA family oxidoreductase [Planctomycetota bacterium]NLZ00297.1 Gfo/Idh/MocA family oxidoreductase [Pirellulaceae bacterium]
MKLRVGLIGLGNAWENRHHPALRALSDRFEVTAVFDQVTHRAATAAALLETVHVEGFRDLVHREDVDAVLMLGDGWYGVVPVLAACASGKSVYFARSIDIAPEQAADMHRHVQRAGIAFLAEFVRRHSPATVRLKELIATSLGEPRLLFCHARNPLPSGADHPCIGGTDPCRQEILELIDWCRFVVGSEPRWVVSTAHRELPRFPNDVGQVDYQSISLDFSERELPGTGAMAEIRCSRYIPHDWTEALGYRPQAGAQIACQRGIAFLDLPSTLVWFDQAGRHQEPLDNERPVGQVLLTRFHRAVTSLVAKASDLEDACRAIHILDQAARSQEEGRRIELA